MCQHLDLIYSQSGNLYNVIPNAPHNSNASATQHPGEHADGIFGATFGAVVKQLSDHIVEMSVDPSTKSTSLPTTTINFMQSTQKPGGKNKKNKKKTTPSEEQSKKQYNQKQKVVEPSDNGKDRPTRFPCKIYAETT